MSSNTVLDLEISRASAWIFNCYVVDAGPKLVVIDPGLPVVARRALEIIEQNLERPVDDIGAINCTHAHPDHVAGETTLTERASCDVHLPRRC